jgi:arylsulfatase A-like enzyme
MPYSPSPASPLRPLTSLAAVAEAVRLPAVLPKISSHAYLRPGFRMSEAQRRMLLGRYESAIELMDAKLEQLWNDARTTGLLDDTLLVVTSDHGEAFGEHGLYFHDASVWQTHLHVPLWVHHPDCAPRAVDDVVSTRDLFGLMRSAGLGLGIAGTLLDAAAVARRPVALAEHFHYALGGPILPQYATNLASAIVGGRKIAVRGDRAVAFDLAADPGELDPQATTIAGFLHECRRDGAAPAALDAAAEHLQRWSAAAVAA